MGQQRPFSWLRFFGNSLIQNLPFLLGLQSFIRRENEKSLSLLNPGEGAFLTSYKKEVLGEEQENIFFSQFFLSQGLPISTSKLFKQLTVKYHV